MYWHVLIMYWHVLIMYWHVLIMYWHVLIMYWHVLIMYWHVLIMYWHVCRGQFQRWSWPRHQVQLQAAYDVRSAAVGVESKGRLPHHSDGRWRGEGAASSSCSHVVVGSLRQTQFSSSQFSAAPMVLMSDFTQSIHLCVFLFFFSRAVLSVRLPTYSCSRLYMHKPPQSRFHAPVCDLLHVRNENIKERMKIEKITDRCMKVS